MPNFTDPFVQNVPGRKMTLAELVRAIRIDMAAELDATSLYEAHAEATDNPLAKKVFIDIANEERVHVGEFQRLLEMLLPDEEGWLGNGYDEVEEMAGEVARGDLEPDTPEEKRLAESRAEGDGRKSGEDRSVPTIGSMKQ